MVEGLRLCSVELSKVIHYFKILIPTAGAVPYDGTLSQFFLRFRWSQGVVVVVIGTGGEYRRYHCTAKEEGEHHSSGCEGCD